MRECSIPVEASAFVLVPACSTRQDGMEMQAASVLLDIPARGTATERPETQNGCKFALLQHVLTSPKQSRGKVDSAATQQVLPCT